MADLIARTIQKIGPLDAVAMSRAKSRQDTLTKPEGSLGRLEELSIQLAGIQSSPQPRIKDKAVIVMVADHGVVAEGTSAYPQAVTTQMVLNFIQGGAAINVLSRQIGARVIVVDIGIQGETAHFPGIIHRKVAPGTGNMCQGPAMTPDQAVLAVETGIEIVDGEICQGLDIVGTGEMGIGNTTASSAICAAMTGRPVEEVTGRGTGLDDKQLQHKIKVIKKGLEVNHPDPRSALDVLAKVGGLEIAGLAGVMLGAAARRVPVMVDGFISGAAALIAVGVCPGVREYLIPAHVSVEPGHIHLLKHLGLKPLMDLNLRLGEGTGAAAGIWLAEISCHILSEMATFAEAGVSHKGEKQ
jgi:nicotinate-nucleotide--dimethylbenzimidazole phosphoribosyltransferase